MPELSVVDSVAASRCVVVGVYVKAPFAALMLTEPPPVEDVGAL
jgi:hypothetical protein